MRLSLEKKIVFSTLIIILFFAMILWGVVRDRTQDYYQYHQSIAKSSVEKISRVVKNILHNKHKLVESFLEDHEALMLKILNNIDDEDTYDLLDDKLKHYFPDYLTSSIANIKGELLRTEFGDISKLCINDMKDYIYHGVQNIRIHPNATLYHYDILVKYKLKSQKILFITTFSSDVIVSLLNASSLISHNFYLVDKKQNYLIEITKDGSRNVLKDRGDFHLTQAEQERIFASQKIEGSTWTIVDFYDSRLFSDNKTALIRNNLIIFIFFTLLMIFVSRMIIREIQKKELLKDKLEQRNIEIKALNENLKRLSITDPLTGLYNRRFLDTQLKRMWNKASRLKIPLSIAILDIDFFKQYNDYYGHQEGDNCLMTVATLCQESFRRANEICARYGGEEFIIINLGDNKESFVQRLENLFQVLYQKDIKHEDSTIDSRVTISVGLAHSQDKEYSFVNVLLKNADDALYEAKEKGRNQMVVA